ncbi:8760_t:CDS:2, partial [Gigaspora margarita]
VNIPETRVKALVPRKRKTLDLFGKDSDKKMKKVHNTRSNSEEMITALQKTIHTETEDETVAENLQREPEVDDTLAKNFTGFDVEGSGNLRDSQS